MRHLFLINPAAGQGRGAHLDQAARALGERHGLEVDCLFTEGPGDALKLARRAAECGEPVRVYACGGDGTAHEVANGVAGFPNAAMTVVPLGTGNDFLKNFGSDVQRFRDLEQLWNGEEHRLDLIDCGGQQCLTIACCGLDARVARDVHRYAQIPLLGGARSYIASLAVNFLFHNITSPWQVTLDGEELPGREWTLSAVCNGRYYGGGFMPIPEARMCDGVLNVLLVKKISRAKFLRFVGKYKQGRYRELSHLVVCRPVREARLCAQEEIVACLDGECMSAREFTFCLSEKKLLFFAPPGASPDRTALQQSDPSTVEAAV